MSAVVPSDLEDLYRLSFEGRNWISWRFRGLSIGPNDFGLRLWHPEVSTQMIARTRHEGAPVAHLMCYENRGHTAKVGVVASAIYQMAGVPMEAFGCFVDFLFLNWPFRKLYIEMLRPEWERHPRFSEYFQEEGRLTEHEFYGGSYEDLILAACSREHFYSAITDLRRLWLDGLYEGGLVALRSSP